MNRVWGHVPPANLPAPLVPEGQTPTPGAGWVTWAGLAVVLTAAAVLSFAALRDLAVAVGITGRLAWLLPVAVDAGAAVSCAAWLSPRAHQDAARFARSMTWALLATTVVGNAAQLGMNANDVVPPWWVAVLVGAIPPAVVGGTVHLAVLVGRGGPTEAGPTTSAEAGGQTEAQTDADLLEHVRAWAGEEAGAVPSRERIRQRYAIGTTRADRLRTAALTTETSGPTSNGQVAR